MPTCLLPLPGDPEYTENEGTTVLGGITVLSVMQQQSLMMANRPYMKYKQTLDPFLPPSSYTNLQ